MMKVGLDWAKIQFSLVFGEEPSAGQSTMMGKKHHFGQEKMISTALYMYSIEALILVFLRSGAVMNAVPQGFGSVCV